MEISSDQEMEEAAKEASLLLQSINTYLVKTNRTWGEVEGAKVRFPRGYLRPAELQRNRMPFIKDRKLKSNLAYTLILSDAVLWLLIRTDISSTAGEMLQKLYIFIIGTLTESITKDVLKGICGKNYKVRTEYLVAHDVIERPLKEDLDWLWDVRNKMHLFQLEEKEFKCGYDNQSHLRSIKAFRGLLSALRSGAIKLNQ